MAEASFDRFERKDKCIELEDAGEYWWVAKIIRKT